MLTSEENDKALLNLSDKLLKIMIDRGIIVSYLLSPLSKIINPGRTSQVKLVKDPNLKRVKDLLINKTMPVTHFYKLSTVRHTDK